MNKPLHDPRQLNLFRSTRFIGTTEAADMLKVSAGTVYKLIDEGLLQAYQRHGRNSHRLISHQSVLDLIEKWANEAFGANLQTVEAAERAESAPRRTRAIG